MNISASLVAILAIVLSAVSCKKEYDFGFKDLCFYHPHTAPVKVNVDWSKFRHIEQPTGMTVYVWPQEPEKENYSFYTHDLSEVTLNLEAGNYNAFVFNQTAPEYATLEFYNLENFEKAEARVTTVKSNWYSTKGSDTKVGSEPEWLAIDCVKDIEVTEEMVKVAEEEYLAGLPEANRHKKTRQVSKSLYEIGTLVPKSIIKNIDIYIHLENMPFLRSALGALEDMAEGCYISSKKTTEAHVTHTIEKWSVEYEKDEVGAEDLMKGALMSSISTFGLPFGHGGSPEENILLIRLLLVDNQTILEMEFPVGDIIADLNEYDGTQLDENGNIIWPELHIYWPEPLPEVEPVGGSGGAFDVGVDGWGDNEEKIELPLF